MMHRTINESVVAWLQRTHSLNHCIRTLNSERSTMFDVRAFAPQIRRSATRRAQAWAPARRLDPFYFPFFPFSFVLKWRKMDSCLD